jgi:hypothetical protein
MSILFSFCSQFGIAARIIKVCLSVVLAYIILRELLLKIFLCLHCSVSDWKSHKIQCKALAAEGKADAAAVTDEQKPPLDVQMQSMKVTDLIEANHDELLRATTGGDSLVMNALATALYEERYGTEVVNTDQTCSDSGNCNHGHVPFRKFGLYDQFVKKYLEEHSRHDGLVESFKEAVYTTRELFPQVWDDPSKLELIRKYFLSWGTQNFLDGKLIDGDLINGARAGAYFAQYFEQFIAVYLNETQSNINWSKVIELERGDERTVFSYLRKNIPCSCLDEKCKEVKHMTKMGICWNQQCSLHKVERSKMLSCTGCYANYCSHACRKADWKNHQEQCSRISACRAEFDANQQS